VKCNGCCLPVAADVTFQSPLHASAGYIDAVVSSVGCNDNNPRGRVKQRLQEFMKYFRNSGR
jgi:hypothetical protein